MYRKTLALIACAAGMVPVSALSVSSVQFYFTSTTGSSPLTNLTIGGAGTTFDVSVWYQVVGDAFPVAGADAFVGFDTSNSYGPGASPLDLKLGLNGTDSTAVSNYWAEFPTHLNLSGGGTTQLGQPATSIRPYGLDVSLATSAGTEISTNPVHLFDISLKNLNLTAGRSYKVVLWDAQDPNAFDSTCWVADIDGFALRPGQEAGTLTVKVVPEPASLIVLGLGALALIRRRRR